MKKKLFAVLLALVMVLSLLPMAALAADFSDTSGHWGEEAIERWADYGVLNGDGTGNFNPDQNMTRAQFAQMLCNLMGYTETARNTFSDVPADAWYADAILKLVAAGVMSGMGDGTAAPDTPISREQAAVMLCRAMNIKPSAGASVSGFTDSGSVSSWARDAVAALTERGMINGMGDGTFAPTVQINRASVSQMVSNMVSDYVTTPGTTITGNVTGIVIIKADNVTIENATLSEPLLVAPAAAGATVSLTGTTSAADVVVEASGAKVVVAETASAKTVEVTAASAGADIAGRVDNVTVAPAAANATVTVEKTGTVTDVNVQAKADVAVSGKVGSIEVAGGADGTNIKTEAGAKVDSVTAAGDTTVSGAAGTVGTVTATGDSNTDVNVSGAKVENNGTGEVTANGKEVPSTSATPSTPSRPSTGGSTGGGGDGAVTYTVTVKVTNPDYGKVTSSATSAEPGTTITLTLAPAEGRESYRLHSMTFKIGNEVVENFDHGYGKDADGKEDVNTRAFVMPSGNVEVTVTFEEDEESGSTAWNGITGIDATGKSVLAAGERDYTATMKQTKDNKTYEIIVEGKITATSTDDEDTDDSPAYLVKVTIPEVAGWGVDTAKSFKSTNATIATGAIPISFDLEYCENGKQECTVYYVPVSEDGIKLADAEETVVAITVDMTAVTIGPDVKPLGVTLEGHTNAAGGDVTTTAGEILDSGITMTLEKSSTDLTIYNVTVTGSTSEHQSATGQNANKLFWVGVGFPKSAAGNSSGYHVEFNAVTEKPASFTDRATYIDDPTNDYFYIGYGVLPNGKITSISYESGTRVVIFNITFNMEEYKAPNETSP